MKLDIKVDTEIAADWERIQPVRLGSDFSPAEPPDAYVMVSKAGIPSQRFDVFYSDTAANFCIKAVHWKQWIAIGCCNLVYLVSLSSDKIIPTPISDDCDFGDYFSDFWSGPDFMLIVGGCGLVRIEPDGHVLWRNNDLGLDGVVLDTVSEASITGSGEWDPPDGWRPFQVSTTTGARIAAL